MILSVVVVTVCLLVSKMTYNVSTVMLNLSLSISRYLFSFCCINQQAVHEL